MYPDTSKLKDYAGVYKQGNTTISFKFEAGHLYVNDQDGPYSRVCFESDDTVFVYFAPRASVRFVSNEQAKVTHILISDGKNEIRADRQ